MVDAEPEQLLQAAAEVEGSAGSPLRTAGAGGEESGEAGAGSAEPGAAESADSVEEDQPPSEGLDEDSAAAVRAELGNLTADLGSQLKSITEEMNRIQRELYSED